MTSLSRNTRRGVLITAAVTALAAGATSAQVGAAGRPAGPSPSASVAVPAPPGGVGQPGSDLVRSGPAASAAAAGTSASWNVHVTCVAQITTLSMVLGSQRSALGGATLAGGGFTPGIPDRRSTNPPCSVGGVPTRVELHKVTVGTCAKINADGDWTCELKDPSIPASVPADLHAIHIEIDGTFRTKGWGPAIPPGGTLIDVQGFVFWDPDHVTAAFHHHSGWELHTFTAWRLAH